MTTKEHIYFNVILTFNTGDEYGDMQEFFDVKLPLNKNEISAIHFVHNKLFTRILKKCVTLGRDHKQLTKISTAGDWDKFEELTKLDALYKFGHPCKWYFGQGRDDLDAWEIMLTKQYGFGSNADMSWRREYAGSSAQ